MADSRIRSVPDYRHRPGQHCGSTALRNLLAFHGAEGLSEEMVFGLGSGAGFYYLPIDGGSPSRFFSGRTARLEESFCANLPGAALERATFEDDEQAWAAARAEVDAGRPALLLTDILHLDHYGNSAGFPGHAVVLAGYDDEAALLSDTGFEALQRTRLEQLALARRGDHPAYPLRGDMFTASGRVDEAELVAAIPTALARAAAEMIEPPFGEFGGLPALERFAAEAGDWPEQTEDWQWCARFAYQVIERRGTGGGCFRLMYSRFLAEAGRGAESSLAAASAARWTELSESFRLAAESDVPDPQLWGTVDEGAGRVLVAERELWASLAG